MPDPERSLTLTLSLHSSGSGASNALYFSLLIVYVLKKIHDSTRFILVHPFHIDILLGIGAVFVSFFF